MARLESKFSISMKNDPYSHTEYINYYHLENSKFSRFYVIMYMKGLY